MNSFRISRIVLSCLFFAIVAFAVPPYLWYGTYSINNYNCNSNTCKGVCGLPNLGTCLFDAAGFHNAVVGHDMPSTNKWYQYNRENGGVTASRWVGEYPEIINIDFLFYAGHGWGFGPFFTGGTVVDPRTDLRFGNGVYLKWVQAAACEWFCHPRYACNVGEVARWTNSFVGVHAVMAHRAATYDHPWSDEMSDAFFDRWVVNGESLYWSWRTAQIDWVYHDGYNNGLQPATIGHNSNYFYETWANAGDEQASDASKHLLLGWATIGDPDYSPENCN
jgi:hypothetical protein